MADPKRNKIAKDKNDSPMDEWKAEQEYNKKKAEKATKEASDKLTTNTDQAETVSLEVLDNAVSDAQQQVETAASAVIAETQPPEPLAEPAAVASLEAEDARVHALVATTEDRLTGVAATAADDWSNLSDQEVANRLAKIAATPSGLYPSLKPRPTKTEPVVEAKKNATPETEEEKAKIADFYQRIDTQFNQYASLVENLTKVAPDVTLNDQDRNFIANASKARAEVLASQKRGEIKAADVITEFDNILKSGEEKMWHIRGGIKRADETKAKEAAEAIEKEKGLKLLEETKVGIDKFYELLNDAHGSIDPKMIDHYSGNIEVFEKIYDRYKSIIEEHHQIVPLSELEALHQNVTADLLKLPTQLEEAKKAFKNTPENQEQKRVQELIETIKNKIKEYNDLVSANHDLIEPDVPQLKFDEKITENTEIDSLEARLAIINRYLSTYTHEINAKRTQQRIEQQSETENFEIERLSLEIEDGIYKFNDLIIKNQDLIRPTIYQFLTDKKDALLTSYNDTKIGSDSGADTITKLKNVLADLNFKLKEYSDVMPNWHEHWRIDQERAAAGLPPVDLFGEGEPLPAATDNAEEQPPEVPIIAPTGGAASPEPATEVPPAPVNEKLAVINIANQARLKTKIAKEATKNEVALTPDQISELAKKQVAYVSASKVEGLIIDTAHSVMLRDLTTAGATTPEQLKQELSNLLIAPNSTVKKQRLKLLATQISNETGLKREEVLEIFANQEQHLADLAKAEVNAGRVTSGTTEAEAQANVKYDRKKTLIKMGFYIGGSIAASAFAPAAVGIGAIYGARVVDNLLFSDRKKRNTKLAELKAKIGSDPATSDLFTQRLFTDIAAAQQSRVSEEKFDYDSFLANNADLITNYDEAEQKIIVKALKVIQDQEQDTYNRENDLLDRLAKKIKKSDNKAVRVVNALGSGFHKFIFRGGETNREKAVSAVALGGAAGVARELPIVKELLAAMGGYKLGEIVANKLLGVENTEKRKITDQDTAQDILDAAEKRSVLDFSTKNKKLAIKLTAALSAGLLAHYLPGIIHNLTNPDTAVPVDGHVAAAAPGVEHAPPPVAAVAEVEIPKVNPLEEALKDMREVHGDKSPHLWGLIDQKVDALFNHLDVKIPEGQETHIIDNIKDQIAKDPTAFGLHKGANIDILTHADLEKLSQNEHFNEIIGGMFNKGSFAEQASNLSTEAVKNIEANNAFNQQVVEQLPKGVSLDQQAYDTMSRMHNQGLSADVTAQALQQSHETAAHITNATGHIPDNLPVSPIRTGEVITGTGTGGSSEALAAASAETVTANTSEVFPLPTNVESYQNAESMSEWQKVTGLMAENNNERGIGKSLHEIFRNFGAAKEYAAKDAVDFAVRNINYKGGELNFDVPPPTNDQLAEQLGDLHFSFNAAKNEMMGYIGDESVSLKNIKNIDKGIKTIFTILADKVR